MPLEGQYFTRLALYQSPAPVKDYFPPPRPIYAEDVTIFFTKSL